MATFGNRFKLLRNEKKLTQQQLADEINSKYNLTFGKSSISLYENNKGTPEMATLEKFADYFNVSVDYLMGRSNIKNINEVIYSNAFHSVSDDGLTKEDIDIVKAMIEQLKEKNK